MFEYLKIKGNDQSEQVTAKDCFNSLTDSQKQLVEKNTTTLEFEKGETIIKQGFIASHILFIEKGLAKLDVTNDNKTSTVKILASGSFVGIICSFACKSMDFSSIALEKTVVQMINMDIFQQLIRENGEFSIKLIQHMSALTNNMVHWITRIGDKNVDGALAILLLEFADIYKSNTYTLPVTRKVLAQIAGFSKESTINTLSHFNHDGIVSVKEKEIKILKLDLLKQIANNG